MLLYGSVPCMYGLSGFVATWQGLRFLYCYVAQSLRDGVTHAGRGCMMSMLSIVTKSPVEPHYLLGGSEPSSWLLHSFGKQA